VGVRTGQGDLDMNPGTLPVIGTMNKAMRNYQWLLVFKHWGEPAETVVKYTVHSREHSNPESQQI
jgi:hypothetical protein